MTELDRARLMRDQRELSDDELLAAARSRFAREGGRVVPADTVEEAIARVQIVWAQRWHPELLEAA